MSKEKETLIFHNRELVYLSPHCLIFFGGNALTLKGKSFFEIFKTDCSFLDKIRENKKNKFTLKTFDDCILDVEITKSTIANDETVCVYFKADLSRVSYKSSYNDKGIYQETVEKNMEEILSEINAITNTRNINEVSKIKKMLMSFSLSVYELLNMKVTNKLTTSDVSFVYTDISEFIKECLTEIKEENPDLIIILTPPILTMFGVNTDKESLKEFLKKAVCYIGKNAEDKKVYFQINQEKDLFSLTVMGTSLYVDFLKASNKNNITNIDEFSDILILNDLAKKSGADFFCTEEENTIDSLKIVFKRQERRRFIED